MVGRRPTGRPHPKWMSVTARELRPPSAESFGSPGTAVAAMAHPTAERGPPECSPVGVMRVTGRWVPRPALTFPAGPPARQLDGEAQPGFLAGTGRGWTTGQRAGRYERRDVLAEVARLVNDGTSAAGRKRAGADGTAAGQGCAGMIRGLELCLADGRRGPSRTRECPSQGVPTRRTARYPGASAYRSGVGTCRPRPGSSSRETTGLGP